MPHEGSGLDAAVLAHLLEGPGDHQCWGPVRRGDLDGGWGGFARSGRRLAGTGNDAPAPDALTQNARLTLLPILLRQQAFQILKPLNADPALILVPPRLRLRVVGALGVHGHSPTFRNAAGGGRSF
jgi:hypothetical protein